MAETSVAPGGAKRRNLRPLRKLLPYLAANRGLVAGAVFFLALASLTTLSLPLAVRRVIDLGFDTPDTRFVDTYFAMLVVLAGLLAVASAGRYYFVVTLGERVVASLRKDVFAQVTRLSQDFYDRTMSGEIVSRLTADTTQVKSAVGSTASLALRNAILVTGSLAMMVFTAPALSFIVIAVIPVIVVPLIAIGRQVRRKSRAAQDTLAHASAYATEAIGAMRTVQAFTAEDMATSRYTQAVDDAFEAARGTIKARAFLTAFAIFLVFSSIVAVLWIGSQQVITGEMTAGTLGQFILYAVFAASALGQLSEVWGDLALAAGATERLTELLVEEPSVPEAVPALPMPQPARGAIAFHDVSFAYPAGGMPAVSGLSFTIRPGETVAIVGPSGAGKSTVFSLIERFYDPTSGHIEMDGSDIRTVSKNALRSRIALVPQDVAAFAASIADNIAFGRADATRDEIESAARSAMAEGFIRDLPEGYDTKVGERGVTLSGGQRQRLAIARAILRDAPVLLLDEATSALDSQSERAVQEGLETLMRGRTTLVIAHRLATVLKADRILVMSGGRIIEEGTHASLSASGGLYSELARMQFRDAAERPLRGAAE
ncbi:ATP-binding cassette, subfamily B [Aureimonas altamirensis DSM 21988]|uniref:ATP-binding protein, ABC-type transporter n=2 Tax=Aureimonas altamirensis TaxID=370622 RepID=A0A0P0YW38_9HYPH|nr:ABC transporter transmembrane domain-containing protein [Aureimonas altamirensis]BAT25670.1 ATP-binding protein, ABC-type transporter [Aureimonas altamirensis]SHI43813.1 ATP-binding cassette, subfamily B [Aureimonas altamirensis DSM 21988]